MNLTYSSECLNEWKTQGREKKFSRVKNRTEIKKGGSSTALGLKAVERKKHLHVWRLTKSTSEADLSAHVKNLLGECDFKVEKVIPKTERDYASFIIGVSEENYQKLCDPEVWPVNVEYSEWIWFRRSTSSLPSTATSKA